MNFRRSRTDDEPEINLVPLIDVLLVILIFLAATTSFTRFSQIKVHLPQASADAPQPQAMNLAISQTGVYALDGRYVQGTSVDDLAQALKAEAAQRRQGTLIIDADAQSTHEAVVRAMLAARQAGIERVDFATQSTP
ncbi:MAG TPA: biopolymer transporter ExbD [Burkholderiaceae bacterium]|nr:biopolymer transporter ExbD [Burkholderiaceae bacterium]